MVLSFGPSLGLFSILFRLHPAYQGLRVPSRAAILFLLAIVLHFTLAISQLFDRNRRLTQEVAWLRFELEQVRETKRSDGTQDLFT